jgi:glycosyltransferase involved in cell wall biosynthesis
MCSFNADKYIHAAIKSILNQTYKNFELIIIDDASNDNTCEIIRTFLRDPRIIYLRNSQNIGLTRSLIKAYSFSSGDYIARMDADDISYPDRFEIQLKYALNRKLDIVGSSAVYIDEKAGFIKNHYMNKNDLSIKRAFFYKNSILHSSVLISREFLEKNKFFYDPKVVYAQDYDLWLRAFLKGATFFNIKRPLIRYRVNSESISIKKQKDQQKCAMFSQNRFYKTILPEIEYDFLKIVHNFSFNTYYRITVLQYFKIIKTLLKILISISFNKKFSHLIIPFILFFIDFVNKIRKNVIGFKR